MYAHGDTTRGSLASALNVADLVCELDLSMCEDFATVIVQETRMAHLHQAVNV